MPISNEVTNVQKKSLTTRFVVIFFSIFLYIYYRIRDVAHLFLSAKCPTICFVFVFYTWLEGPMARGISGFIRI